MNKIYGLISIGIFFSYHSMACVCSHINETKEEYKKSDVVIALKVVEVLNVEESLDTIIDGIGEVWISKPVFG